MRVLTVIGARPQFIKASAVSAAIAARADVEEILVHTGQHYDTAMSDTFFAELGIPVPAHHLGIAGLGHGAMTGRMLEAIEATILQERPDAVLVYGDTNSTLAGALAAAKLHVPVAHVEAGLRSGNRMMPEEVNRVLTDHCSDLLFTPTDTATRNLAREGIPSSRVAQVGDVMLDVALRYGRDLPPRPPILEAHGLEPGAYVLSTLHRQETTDDPERLATLVAVLDEVARTRRVVLPLHPRTRGRIEAAGLGDAVARLTLLPPVGYRDMVALTARAGVVATDSGGLQKEAFFHRVPCVTLRTETEWEELVESGWNCLPSLDEPGRIAAEILDAHGRSGRDLAPYGAGDAAERIVARLHDAYGG